MKIRIPINQSVFFMVHVNQSFVSVVSPHEAFPQAGQTLRCWIDFGRLSNEPSRQKTDGVWAGAPPKIQGKIGGPKNDR